MKTRTFDAAGSTAWGTRLPETQPQCEGPVFEAAEGVIALLVDGPRLRK